MSPQTWLRPTISEAGHTAIQRHLRLLPLYLWIALGWWHVASRLPWDGDTTIRARDFMHFYVLGVIADAHRGDLLYDAAGQADLLRAVIPGVAETMRYEPVYGPQTAVFFAPFGRLSFVHALYAWLALSATLVVGCAFALWQTCPRLRDKRQVIILLTVGCPGLVLIFTYSHVAAVALACVTAAYLALRRDFAFLAGIAIGSLIHKPQLGLLMAFVFVGAGAWRVVAGAIVGAGLQLAIGGFYWGSASLLEYVEELLRLPTFAADLEPLKSQMHSWRSFLDLLGLSPDLALGAYLVLAAATAAVVLRCWRSEAPLGPRYAVLLIGSVLVSPHVNAYDLLVVTPAFLLLWDWVLSERDQKIAERIPWWSSTFAGEWSFRTSAQALLLCCYFAPLSGGIAEVLKVQPSVLLHTLLGGIAVVCLRSPDCGRPSASAVAAISAQGGEVARTSSSGM